MRMNTALFFWGGFHDALPTRLSVPALYRVSVRSYKPPRRPRSFGEKVIGGDNQAALTHTFAGFLPTARELTAEALVSYLFNRSHR